MSSQWQPKASSSPGVATEAQGSQNTVPPSPASSSIGNDENKVSVPSDAVDWVSYCGEGITNSRRGAEKGGDIAIEERAACTEKVEFGTK